MYVHLVAPLNHNLIDPQAQLDILGLPVTADKAGVRLVFEKPFLRQEIPINTLRNMFYFEF